METGVFQKHSILEPYIYKKLPLNEVLFVRKAL